MIFAFKNSFNYKKQHLFFAVYRKYYIAKKVKKWNIYTLMCIYVYIYYYTILGISKQLKQVSLCS